jgi:hypothetical protein
LALNAVNKRELKPEVKKEPGPQTSANVRMSEQDAKIQRVVTELRKMMAKEKPQKTQDEKTTTERPPQSETQTDGKNSKDSDAESQRPNNKEEYRKNLAQGLAFTIQFHTRRLMTRREGIKLVETIEAEARPALAVLDPEHFRSIFSSGNGGRTAYVPSPGAVGCYAGTWSGKPLPEPKNSR